MNGLLLLHLTFPTVCLQAILMRCLWAIVRWARISVIAASLVPERNFIDSGYVILTAVNLEIKGPYLFLLLEMHLKAQVWSFYVGRRVGRHCCRPGDYPNTRLFVSMAIETICFQWSSNKSQEKIIRVSNPNSLNIPLHEFAEFVNTTKC